MFLFDCSCSMQNDELSKSIWSELVTVRKMLNALLAFMGITATDARPMN